ncbi:MAG: hypothetical protein AAF908_05185 [Pseudomonadota bacterium]
MQTAAFLVDLATWWLWAGAAIAALFLTIGIDRVDEDARGAYVFRALLIPAVLLIWPLVIWRWVVLERGRDRWALRHRPPRHAHLRVAVAMGVLIPVIFLGALLVRQTWPADYAPVLLEAPG